MSSNDRTRSVVHGLWIGERLGAMEQLSILSFLVNGHPYRLYAYGPMPGVPEGTEVMPAHEVLPKESIWKYREHDSVAGFSNHFRYQVLFDQGGIWADCDVVCRRPLELAELAIAGEQDEEGKPRAATCLLAAPRKSLLLRRALDVCEASDVTRLRWGDTGPTLMARLVAELGLHDAVHPPRDFCPVPWTRYDDLFSADRVVQRRVRTAIQGAQAVHLWHECWRRFGNDPAAEYPAGCAWQELRARYAPRASERRLTSGE